MNLRAHIPSLWPGHGAGLYKSALIAFAVIALRLVSPAARGEMDAATPPNALVRQVVNKEIQAEAQDHSHWMYRREIDKPDAQKEVDEVIETASGDLKRPILANGRKLTIEEQQRSVEQSVEDHEKRQKSLKDKKEDYARSQQMLKLLPDAFVFTYGAQRGDLIQLEFTPDPHFHPPSHEAEVFHAMAGELWVDSKQLRLAAISGHLLHKVKFGAGLLGHLEKGGTFDVKQSEVAPDCWELTMLNVQMKGKALFFETISVQQRFARSDFKRVPDDLTLAQAAKLLNEQLGKIDIEGDFALLRNVLSGFLLSSLV